MYNTKKKKKSNSLKISASPSFEIIDWDDPKNYNKLPLPSDFEKRRNKVAPGYEKTKDRLRRMGLAKPA